jgi:hypothetical protein
MDLAKRLREEELLRQDERKFFRDDPYIKRKRCEMAT